MPISPLRPARSTARRPLLSPPARPCALVIGDLLLDVVVIAEGPLAPTEVEGSITLCQGGAAATTARWLSRLAVKTTLVTSVGRDAPGRALVEAMRAQGVEVRAARPAGERTGRTAVLALPGGRSLVSDRGAADALPVAHLREAWFDGIDLVHLPGFAPVSSQLSEVAREAVRLARAGGALVSLDMPPTEAVADHGYRRTIATIRELAPDILLGTAAEALALLAARPLDGLLELAPAVVVKRGASGATAMTAHNGATVRVEVATKASAAKDPTGAGDAFDAGFLAAWLSADSADGRPVTLQKAVAAGHRAATRHLETPRPELRLG